MRRSTAVVLVLAAALAACAPASAKVDVVPTARDQALGYLATQGGGGPFPAGLAPYAVEAAVAGGLDPAAWPAPARSALASVEVPDSSELLHLVRPAYAIAIAGGNLADWHGEDLLARLRAGFDGTQFGEPSLANDDFYAVLALRAAGVPADDPAVAAAAQSIASRQNADGGWGFADEAPSGTDTTGMALAALEAAGRAVGPRAAALGFLATTRQATGGFAEEPGQAANCDSTVWALRALRGEDGDQAAWTFLLRLQQPDGGLAHRPGQPSNALCTAEAAALFADAAAGRIAMPDYAGGRGMAALPGPGVLAAVVAVALAARGFDPSKP